MNNTVEYIIKMYYHIYNQKISVPYTCKEVLGDVECSNYCLDCCSMSETMFKQFISLGNCINESESGFDESKKEDYQCTINSKQYVFNKNIRVNSCFCEGNIINEYAPLIKFFIIATFTEKYLEKSHLLDVLINIIFGTYKEYDITVERYLKNYNNEETELGFLTLQTRKILKSYLSNNIQEYFELERDISQRLKKALENDEKNTLDDLIWTKE